MRARRLALGGALVILGSVMLVTGSAAASPASPVPSSPAATTNAAFLDSANPKTVVLDPATGAVVSVTLGEPAVAGGSFSLVTPAISSGTDCQAGDGCYYTPVVDATYHDRSFSGSPGTFTGDWPRRNAWDTGNYTAYACWRSACSQSYGPNTYLSFGGSLVTGTSFTIQ